MVTVSDVKEQYDEVDKEKFWIDASITYNKIIEDNENNDIELVKYGEYEDGELNINYFMYIVKENDESIIYGGSEDKFN